MTKTKKTDKDSKLDADSIRFADAIDELQTIVTELEGDDVDVDVMAERVERAAFLVAMCRDRLDATRFRVEEIIGGLDEDTDLDKSTDDVTDDDPTE
ncbi:MAG: exodeoxyribonuclease VII small subunit [Microthrixaceae bacterium]